MYTLDWLNQKLHGPIPFPKRLKGQNKALQLLFFLFFQSFFFIFLTKQDYA